MLKMQVWDPEKVVIIPDHYIFTSDPRANRNVDILRCLCSFAPACCTPDFHHTGTTHTLR